MFQPNERQTYTESGSENEIENEQINSCFMSPKRLKIVYPFLMLHRRNEFPHIYSFIPEFSVQVWNCIKSHPIYNWLFIKIQWNTNVCLTTASSSSTITKVAKNINASETVVHCSKKKLMKFNLENTLNSSICTIKMLNFCLLSYCITMLNSPSHQWIRLNPEGNILILPS